MKVTLNNILAVTIPENKLRFLLLLITIVIDGVLEITGIASIMPFLAVLANQHIIQTNSILSSIYTYFGFSSNSQFLVFFALAVLTVLVISNCFSAITKWYSLQFVYSRGNYLACRLYQNYLSKPYSFFLDSNSSTLIKNITIETHRITFGVISPVILIFNKIITIFLILGLLVYIDPLLSLLVLIIAGGSFLIIFNLTKKKLGENGKHATENQAARHKISSESLLGIKFLKLLNKEKYFIDNFKKYSSQFSTSEASAQVIATLPKFVLETIIFGGVVLITLYFIIYRNDTNNILPALGIYALAGYRILPGLNLIIHGTSLIKFHSSSLESVSNDLFCKMNQPTSSKLPLRSIDFKDKISLQHITYKYPSSDNILFSELDLTIRKNDIIALVGKTGSGKSTLIDLILGLLKPQNGSILIDNNMLDEKTIVSWQKIVGYVPQHIYLSDNTVKKNIAFGLPEKDIDFLKVKQAATIAEIDDFISLELPNGYDTVIGENGIRLSGGQRQRIGIARAFYLEPQILVLDEATSSLDTATEKDIMNSIYKLSDKITIILVTHRLSSIIGCDKIYFLEKGAIIASGSYKELLKTCPSFSKLVQVPL